MKKIMSLVLVFCILFSSSSLAVHTDAASVDMLEEMSSSEQAALFDSLLYPMAATFGYDGGELDCSTIEDADLLSELSGILFLFLDYTDFGATQQSIKTLSGAEMYYSVFAESDFQRMTRQFFGREIDMEPYKEESIPFFIEYTYYNFLYDGHFYLFQGEVGHPGYGGDPVSLSPIASDWYNATFTWWWPGGEGDAQQFSSVVKRNSDGTWTLRRLFADGYVPTQEELLACCDIEQDTEVTDCDILGELSAEEQNALFNDLLLPIVDSFGHRGGLDCKTIDDASLVMNLDSILYMGMDLSDFGITYYSIDAFDDMYAYYSVFAESDFQRVTKQLFGREIDMEPYKKDEIPNLTSYEYPDFLYNGHFYLVRSTFGYPGCDYSPISLSPIVQDWYHVTFSFWIPAVGSVTERYSAVVRHNDDGTWTLRRLFADGYVPTQEELLACCDIEQDTWEPTDTQAESVALAVPSTHKVQVNGTPVSISAYNISGNNYFKLRDIATILNDTSARFQVGYDASTNRILIERGKNYVRVGGELAPVSSHAQFGSRTNSAIYVDGNLISPTAYNIEGYNFFMLRDLGEKIGFEVGWNETTKTIEIKTKQPGLNVDIFDEKTSSFTGDKSYTYNGAELVNKKTYRANGDTTIEVDMTIPPGAKVYVDGGLEIAGRITFSPGAELITTGDVTVTSNGAIDMSSGGTISCDETFTFDSNTSHRPYLTNGTIKVGNDFESKRNFYATEENEVHMIGNRVHTINMWDKWVTDDQHFNMFRVVGHGIEVLEVKEPFHCEMENGFIMDNWDWLKVDYYGEDFEIAGVQSISAEDRGIVQTGIMLAIAMEGTREKPGMFEYISVDVDEFTFSMYNPKTRKIETYTLNDVYVGGVGMTSGSAVQGSFVYKRQQYMFAPNIELFDAIWEDFKDTTRILSIQAIGGEFLDAYNKVIKSIISTALPENKKDAFEMTTLLLENKEVFENYWKVAQIGH